MELHHGDCLEVLRTMPSCSVDAVVTDPPYGLAFMGKRWDYDVPSVEIWAECLRVLKPGGHLLAFAGTRTQHRMAVRIEDAGFEIRDMIAWVYGSGFPKSMDISKAIDKAAGAEREVVGQRKKLQSYGAGANDIYGDGPDKGGVQLITAPAPESAQQWQGWGTALKPALEPITVARKPFKGTVAQNVLEHGTGGLNIDGCRIPGVKPQVTQGINSNASSFNVAKVRRLSGDPNEGRWPANLIHDGSDEVVKLFPQAKGQQGAISGKEPSDKTDNVYGNYAGRNPSEPRNDSGSAARFFYCAKTSKRERGEGNNHPTVKPIALMSYLCRLVTPPSGIVLDPFMGSGSTGKAATLEGFEFIGIERDADSYATAERRINKAAAIGHQPSLL